MATIVLLNRYGSKLAYNTEIEVNFTGLFSGKFLPWLVFWFVLSVVFGIGCAASMVPWVLNMLGRYDGDVRRWAGLEPLPCSMK